MVIDINTNNENFRIPQRKGTYLLIINILRYIEIKVGSLGIVKLEPGIYIYVGSALAPGGLQARILRHLRKEKKIHWHIDYLLASDDVRILYIAYLVYPKKLESTITSELISLGLKPGWYRFGSTDTKDPSHLLRLPNERDLESILKILKDKGWIIKPTI